VRAVRAPSVRISRKGEVAPQSVMLVLGKRAREEKLDFPMYPIANEVSSAAVTRMNRLQVCRATYSRTIGLLLEIANWYTFMSFIMRGVVIAVRRARVATYVATQVASGVSAGKARSDARSRFDSKGSLARQLGPQDCKSALRHILVPLFRGMEYRDIHHPMNLSTWYWTQTFWEGLPARLMKEDAARERALSAARLLARAT